MDNKQLEFWTETTFGESYTDRNQFDYQIRVPAWKEMLSDLELKNILEVGCNRAYNLQAIRENDKGVKLFGIEPNLYARRIAQENRFGAIIYDGTTLNIPYSDNSFDLSFTSNVLIHVSLENLPKSINEIYRVSKKYILCIEYFDDKETMIHYRGHNEVLWKRDFRAHYEATKPNLKLIKSGFWDMKNGFDDSHWWLFSK